jgi:hypothetical protein
MLRLSPCDAAIDAVHVDRGHPLLPGNPTTVHTPLRQAFALGIRLGCPLQQIFYTLLATAPMGGTTSTDRPALHIYSLSKARTIWLSRAVHASFSHAVSGAGAVAWQQAA